VDRSPDRNKLAFIGGFVKPREDHPQGSEQSAYLVCQQIAATGGYAELHVYQESARDLTKGVLTLPSAPPAKLFDKSTLVTSGETYSAIYAANGEHITSCPFVLRPQSDWAPLICSVGTSHSSAQWTNLLVALASGALRRSDGFIFKSRAARRIFSAVWAGLVERLALSPGPPELTEVIPNGVDVLANRRDEQFRHWTRRRLQLRDSDVVFLSFSRINDGTKGDQLALVVRFRQVLQRLPNAVLIIAGAVMDRPRVAELRSFARTAGVADRVIVVENPSEEFSNPRRCLMSAADAFLHLSTGLQEASPNVIAEAMAHGLPVIATDWAGAAEMISEGETGYLIETQALPVSESSRASLFGQSHNAHATSAARVVVCAFSDFVERAVALGDADLRGRLGARARAVSEERSLQQMTARYVAFFDQVSQEAERSWTGPAPFRPLVEIDGIVSRQASRRLHAESRMRLGDPAGFVALSAGTTGEDPSVIAAVIACLRQEPRTVGEVAVEVSAALGRRGEPEIDAVRAVGPLLARMLNYGAVELA
jgi:glycosyltransferase involved in cell wall biosynthesis